MSSHPWWEKHVVNCSQTLKLPHWSHEHDLCSYFMGQSKSSVHVQLLKNWESTILLGSCKIEVRNIWEIALRSLPDLGCISGMKTGSTLTNYVTINVWLILCALVFLFCKMQITVTTLRMVLNTCLLLLLIDFYCLLYVLEQLAHSC